MNDPVAFFRGFTRSLPRVIRMAGVPFRVHGRWSSIRLTRPGFVFFGMLLVLLFGSINHGNNLGYLLTFLLGSMALVSVLHTLRNVSGLVPVSGRAEPVFAGQNAPFAITMQSVPRTRTSISLHFPDSEPTIGHLGEGGPKTVTVFHRTARRGLLKPPFLIVSTTYPLGLFRVSTRLPVDASCLVYPKPVDGPMLQARGPVDDDSEGENGGSGVEDFAGLEAYRHGDPLHHISWKAFSRGQGLYTKKFEGQQGRTLYFDPDAVPGRDLEEKLSRICAMVLKADALRLAYGLRLGDRLIGLGQGGSHKRQCLQELALAWK